ncbi:MAG: DUF6748 domain-containing protein [Pyrinomonadaceae bacterium]
MNTTSHVQKVSFVAVITVLSCAIGMWPSTSGSSHPPDPEQLSANSPGTNLVAPEPLAGSGEYYFVRQDRRRCISPLCGGYFVKRVNQSRTRCANGRRMSECYVAEIDWKGQPEVDPGKALLRGDVVARRFARFGNLGALRVTESWQSPNGKPATGTIYRVRDRGVRCITHPCLTHTATRLNLKLSTNVAGVDLAAAGADGSEAAAAMTNPDGVMVAGYFSPVRGPAGRAQILKATKFYLLSGSEVGGPSTGAKRCFKTGCSSHVCSDRDVVTTCEFRPEYACYQKAMCERQRTGECGFTQTAELTACLARARR